MSMSILIQVGMIFAQVVLLACICSMVRHRCGKPRSKQEWLDLFKHCDQQDNLRTMKKTCRIPTQDDNVDYDEVREMRDMLIGGENA
jgi:hypothetical protein